jgi:deoxyribose-phosphate aldolase
MSSVFMACFKPKLNLLLNLIVLSSRTCCTSCIAIEDCRRFFFSRFWFTYSSFGTPGPETLPKNFPINSFQPNLHLGAFTEYSKGSGTSTLKKTMTYPKLSKYELAQKIDHTLLKPTLTTKDLEQTCQEAKEYQFKTVCIPPTWVPHSIRLLQGSGVQTITVVGFPLGYSTSESKAFEAKQAIDQGASEIDMVLNVSLLKSKDLTRLQKDVEAVALACGQIPLKVILETAYLTADEKDQAALLCEKAGASFIKTSTGFASGVPETGAKLSDITRLREILKSTTRIKASGGIRDTGTALAFLAAGADRLGTSSGVAILNGSKSEGTY